MRKVFLEDLPKWEDGQYKGKIKWKDCVGYKVRFIYDDIEDEVKIIDYKYPIVKIEYKGNIYSYENYRFLKCPFGVMLGKYNKDYLFNVNEKIDTISGSIVILEQIKVKRSKDNIKGYKYKCLIDGHIDTTSEYHLKAGRGCSVCGYNKVVKGINDISTTHPHLMGYFLNIEDAYSVSHGSEKEFSMKCKDCGYKRNRVIKDLVRNGFACPQCSDGFSYPEKFVFNMLSQLSIEFIVQYNPKWVKPKRYDFYIPYLNCIIETHGEQHYHNSFKIVGSRDLKEEILNDSYKKEIALMNGIDKYIELDCQKSELGYVRNSVRNSELKNIFNLSKVNWQECHEFASDTRVKEVSLIWNTGIHSTIEIGKIINLHGATVRRYLKMGRELGWNDYDEYQASIRGGMLQKKKVICLNNMDVFECSKEVEDKYGVNRAHVNLVCNHRSKYITINDEPFVFMFYEEYINREIDEKKIIDEVIDLHNKKIQKRVVCLNTNEIFKTLKEASDKYQIVYQGIISCCKGEVKHAGRHPETQEKLVWIYYKDYINLSEDDIKDLLPKKVMQFSKNMEFLRKYESIETASENLNMGHYDIKAVCDGKKLSTKGFIFIYEDDYDKKDFNFRNRKTNAKIVIQLDSEDNVLNEYTSVKEAMDKTKVNHVSSVCRGERKSAGGYKWMYREDYEKYIEEQQK